MPWRTSQISTHPSAGGSCSLLRPQNAGDADPASAWESPKPATSRPSPASFGVSNAFPAPSEITPGPGAAPRSLFPATSLRERPASRLVSGDVSLKQPSPRELAPAGVSPAFSPAPTGQSNREKSSRLPRRWAAAPVAARGEMRKRRAMLGRIKKNKIKQISAKSRLFQNPRRRLPPCGPRWGWVCRV